MAIEDYLPNVFGSSAPSYLQGLLGAEETQKLQSRANVQGLLGAGLALAQGMSRVGPRRSAAENILGALAGGFGAAGGAYDQGVKNYVTQQQIAQTQLAQGQAVSKLRSIAEAKAKYPDLAPLFDIDSGEAVKQVINRERAKMYGFGTETQPPAGSAQMPAQMPAQVQQTELPSALSVTPNGQTQQAPQPAQAQAIQLVDPVNVAKANDARKKAALAMSLGDKDTATFFQNEAERLDPKEQIFFRDGVLISSKRGVLGRASEAVRLTKEQATAEGLPTDQGQIWQKTPDNKISLIEGTNLGTQINKKQLIESLPSQFTSVYPTLKPRVDALIKRANGLTSEQINNEAQKILEDDSKILAELDPRLRAVELEKRKAIKTDVNVYTGQLGKTTAGQVEQGALSDAAAVTRLNNIQFSYKPEYQNIKFRTGQAWNTLRDKFGKLPDSEKRQLAEYSQYKQNSLQNLNQTIKDITGAAMGVQEAERIIASLPNAGTDIFSGDSPTEFEAKLNNAVKQTKYALARKNYALKSGLKWEDTPLDSMPSIINKRGSEIAKNYNLDPKKPADLQTINRQLAAEFGIAF
jgi:hypothetical protein